KEPGWLLGRPRLAQRPNGESIGDTRTKATLRGRLKQPLIAVSTGSIRPHSMVGGTPSRLWAGFYEAGAIASIFLRSVAPSGTRMVVTAKTSHLQAYGEK